MKLSHFLGLALLALVGLSLGSCASIASKFSAAQAVYTAVTTATVAQNKAAALHDAIAGVEGNADIFLETSPCNTATPSMLCKDVATALKALRAADDSLVNALVAAQTAGTSVGVASTAYNSAVTAFNAYSAAKTGTPAS